VYIVPFNIILFIGKSLCAVKTIYNFEKYGVGTREGSTTIFSLFLKQTIIHPLLILSMICLYSWCWKNICGPPVSCAMTQNSLNLINKWEKYWKVFDDRYMFDDGQFYPSLNQTIFSLRFFILHCTFGFKQACICLFLWKLLDLYCCGDSHLVNFWSSSCLRGCDRLQNHCDNFLNKNSINWKSF
jgi:hypothetical protein